MKKTEIDKYNFYEKDLRELAKIKNYDFDLLTQIKTSEYDQKSKTGLDRGCVLRNNPFRETIVFNNMHDCYNFLKNDKIRRVK